MVAALACSKILKELAKEEEDTDTTDEMLALAEQYENKAIGEWEGNNQNDSHIPQCWLAWLMLCLRVVGGVDGAKQGCACCSWGRGAMRAVP